MIPMSSDSLLGRAVSSGRIEGALAGVASVTTGMPFGGEPGCAVALPISSGAASPPSSMRTIPTGWSLRRPRRRRSSKFAELLLMHATLVLFRSPPRRAAPASPRSRIKSARARHAASDPHPRSPRSRRRADRNRRRWRTASADGPITGGTFEGRGELRVRGRVVPGGADWQLIHEDGLTEADAKYVLECESGATVVVRNRRTAACAAGRHAAAACRERVDPSSSISRRRRSSRRLRPSFRRSCHRFSSVSANAIPKKSCCVSGNVIDDYHRTRM